MQDAAQVLDASGHVQTFGSQRIVRNEGLELMADEMSEYGRANLLQQRLGLSGPVGEKIAAIVTFAGGIEFYLERALWKLRSIDPAGIRPDTDARMISDLIAMLKKFAVGHNIPNERAFLEEWCKAASDAFEIRNNIVHGVPTNLGETLSYMRNPRWQGEIRKRDFGDFWADEHSLNLVREGMAVLIRIIFQVAQNNVALQDVASTRAVKALRTARSVLGEFADQDYNPSFEKY